MSSIVCRDRAHKTPSEPKEVQQGPGVSSSGYVPLPVLQGARSPQQGHAFVTQVSMHIAQLISDVIYTICRDHTHKIPSGPEEVQQGLGVVKL